MRDIIIIPKILVLFEYGFLPYPGDRIYSARLTLVFTSFNCRRERSAALSERMAAIRSAAGIFPSYMNFTTASCTYKTPRQTFGEDTQ